MARVRTAVLRVLAAAAAAAVVLGLAGRDDFFVGTVYAMVRWPVLLVLVAAVVLSARRGRPGVAVAALALVVAGLAEWGAIRARRAEPAPPVARESLEILSFNLLFRGGDPSASMEVLSSTDADVIALQEVTSRWRDRVAEPLRARYPHQIWHPDRGTHGFAILSKVPLGEPTYLENDARRSIAQCAEVRVPEVPVYLCNVHLSSPAKALWHRSARGFAANAERRAREWERLAALVEERAPTPRRIIAGDLNTMPHDPLHRAITRRWVDAWQWARGGLHGATWPNLHGRTPVPLFRIDYVLVQGPVVPEATTVLGGGGSDHLPLRARVRL